MGQPVVSLLTKALTELTGDGDPAARGKCFGELFIGESPPGTVVDDRRFGAEAEHEHHVLDALDRLTEREREVLVRVALGLNNAEIAGELHMSESTAKTHLKRLMMKLHLRDRVAAVVFAYEAGLVHPGATP